MNKVSNNNGANFSLNSVTTEISRTSSPDQKTQTKALSVLNKFTQKDSEKTKFDNNFDNNSKFTLLNQPSEIIHEILSKKSILSIRDILNFGQVKYIS